MGKIRLPTEQEVWAFALQVPIATKDFGVAPIQGWGTQRHLVQEILAGKARGVNQFVVVKARQVGASTILLLLTLYWMWRFPGLQGLTVTDGDENKQYFRDLFLSMVEELALRQESGAAPNFEESATEQQKLRSRNQVQITWHNQSRLLLQTAGKRTWSRLGVGRGLSFLHGTEIGLWHKGMQALTYLRSAFSEINPAALYVLEGTARGKNWYYDLWLSAMSAQTIHAIFLSWWMREDQRIRKTQKKLYAQYGEPSLTAKEREWDKLVRRRHKVTISPEQWAWRRWYVAEKAGGNHRLADQEQPTVWEDAFSASQERPFLDQVTQSRLKALVEAPTAAYTYAWGAHLEDTHPVPAGPNVEPMLLVWERPDFRPVVVSAVPAYSILDDPAWVISVWSAALDRERLEQVAEFATDLSLGLQPFAWIALHLAGAYGAEHRTFMLEVNGLGMGVLAEIRRLVNLGWGTSRRAAFTDFLGGLRHYVWRRPDAIGAMGALQWKSTPETQGRLLHQFRDQIQRGLVEPHSPALVEELSRMEGKGESFDPAGDTPRGHRVYAAAMALEAYITTIFPLLKRYRGVGEMPTSVAQRTVQEFVASLGGR